MKSLKDYILEGAALADRSYDRFFGDKLNRHKDVKMSIAKSMRNLKMFESHFSSDELKMLKELIDNRQNKYGDDRSNVYIGYYHDKREDHDFLLFSFTFRMNNFPNAIVNQIDKGLTRKYPNLHLSCHLNSFGTTQTLSGDVSYYDKNKGSNEEVVAFIKDLLAAIKPIYNDIISFKDDSRDEDEVNRRKWQQ